MYDSGKRLPWLWDQLKVLNEASAEEVAGAVSGGPTEIKF